MLARDVVCAVGLVGLALLACSSGNKETCVSAIDYQGTRYSSLGTGSSKAAARDSATTGACIAYCQHGDPAIERKWKAWKATPEGQKSKTGRSFDIFLRFKAEKRACEARCDAAVGSGSARLKTECKK